jgi:transposase
MAAHVRTVEIPDADRQELRRRARSKGAPARVVERARIVLPAGEGMPGKQIAARVGCAEPTVVTWRRRYAESGLAGLEDLPRPGSPSPLPETLRDRVLELTLTEPPIAYGATHWSSRLLAAALAAEGTPISHATVARIWHRFGVQPWRAETFKFSTDPRLEGKIRDVVGLYLHPPATAVVLRVDEKPRLQALERTAPALPTRPGSAERQTFDYVRHGTTTLFAAREVATGKVTDACTKVTDACTERHRHQEFLAFLTQVAAAYPAASCTWWSTTTPPTSIRRCAPGSSGVPGCGCTSPPPRAPG